MGSILNQAIDAQNQNILFPIPRPTDGSKAYRVEIDELLSDDALTNLFLIALRQLQDESLLVPKTGAKNWWSFYSIGGIHGQPSEAWAGIRNDSGGMNGSYCHHAKQTFPTWHRAYMFQLEQSLYIRVNQIAAQYPDKFKAVYSNAAARFRLPFWDPIMPRNRDDSKADQNAKAATAWFWGIPIILRTPTVFVRFPKTPETLDPIANPLYQFSFPDSSSYTKANRPALSLSDGGFGWQTAVVNTSQGPREQPVTDSFSDKRPNYQHTVRVPTGRSKGDSDYERLELNLQMQMNNTATYFWQLLSPVRIDGKTKSQANEARSWELFSNHAFRDADVNDDQRFRDSGLFDQRQGRLRWIGSSRSLESWHDDIHMLFGTGEGYVAHMGSTAFAGFDPVFWLHHNNIERMLCIYQALYPGRYVTPGKSSNPRTELFAEDGLSPFLKSKSKFWTSQDLQDWTKCGYAMPGDKNTPEVAGAVKEYLFKNYYWATIKGAKPDTSQLAYPKDLSRSEALTGKASTAAPQPMLIQAISHSEGRPSLVARRVAAPILNLAPEENVVKAESIEANVETAAVKVEDTVVESSVITQHLKLEEAVYPADALIDVEKETSTKMNTWNAHFKIKKFAYEGSFNVHFFIGDISQARPANYLVRMNEAGFSGVFTSRETDGCDNCKTTNEEGGYYTDVVPLTNVLVDYIQSNPISEGLISDGDHQTITDLSAEQVVPFLKEHLRWRLQSKTGELLSYYPESELEVAVAARIFVPPRDGTLLGTYSPSRAYGQITAGKDGGYSGPDVDIGE